MTTFLSSEWIDQWWGRLRADEGVRSEGASWVHGPLLLVVEAEADTFDRTVGIRIDLHEGEVRDLRVVDTPDAARSPFAIAGPYSRWKGLFATGTPDLIDLLLGARLRVKGDLPALNVHRPLWSAFFAAAGGADIAFPDDVPAQAAEPATAR
jgi:hypothetical protein